MSYCQADLTEGCTLAFDSAADDAPKGSLYMALVRGMVFKTYTADNGDTFQTLVDADEAAIAARGWAAAVPGGDLLPRGFKERRVHGVSATTGRRGSARVGATTATLWTGAATTFTVEADDNTIDTMTVTSRTGEKRRLAR